MAAIGNCSLLAERIPANPLTRELSWNLRLSPSFFFSRYTPYTRGLSISTKAHNQPTAIQAKHEIPSLNTSINLDMNSNLKVSEKHDYSILISCKFCEARSMKTMASDSYKEGVVIAKCDACDNLHVIADRLGLFGEPDSVSVEDFLAARGEEIKNGPSSTVNLTLKIPSSNTSINLDMNSNLKVSEKHDYNILISCKFCEARSMKTMASDSYKEGVVIAKCDACDNLHVIADRLGLFGEPDSVSVEDFLAARGEEIKNGPSSTLNLTLKTT
ncbi:Zim17-type zinc finger protein [Striga hermonthica]|uniref:Zim17-type zinc finger protein n=1 Tax=Striga hermonthica TaxID=68872 RepID=A0A9N7RB22_STRHE|nr:Zim17-type zinc finger protein [Striga hermonthica]